MPDDPAEIGRKRALTREPDTVSTVGGKDAHMGYRGIALHPDGCDAILFYYGKRLSHLVAGQRIFC